MPENNQMMSLEGQLVGMPLAGPESFSQQQLEYLKRALGVDETVLFDGTITSSLSTGTLSETVSNFSKIKILCKLNTTTNDSPQYFEFTVDGTHNTYSMLGAVTSSTGNCYVGHAAVSISGTTITYTYGNQMQFGQTPTNNKNATIYKVIGVHRIAGGNQ